MHKLILVTMTALAVTGCTYAHHGSGDDRSIEGAGLVASRNVDIAGDAEFAGMLVRVNGEVGRDLSMAGASVRSDAKVGGDLEAAAARLRFTGEVDGDAELAGASIDIDATFHNNVSMAGAKIELDGLIEGELEIYGHNVELKGEVRGPVKMIGQGDTENGSLVLSGRFMGGGAFCATEIEVERSAEFAGDFVFVADAEPANLPAGAVFEALDGRECDRIDL